MKQSIKQIIIAVLVLTLVMAPAIAWAHDGEDDGDDSVTSSETEDSEDEAEDVSDDSSYSSKRDDALESLRERLAEKREERMEMFKDSRADLQERLQGTKKKACENHQNTISRLVNVMNKRRSNAYDRITKISEAIKKFYSEQNSLQVANYDDLATAVDAAEEAAKTALDGQLAVPELNCDGDHPRADVTDFRQKRLDSIDAMKAFRDAVRELGKAIRAAINDTKSTDTEG